MPSITSILKLLKSNYPQFSFEQGGDFLWSSSNNTIYYDNNAENSAVFLLHELSHALLGHSNYDRDIQLVIMERQAWDYTIKLAPQYNITVSDDMVQSTLDSYRDWMHKRSTCPKCHAIGSQTNRYIYKCPACNNNWQVNEARTCDLRRYNIKK